MQIIKTNFEKALTSKDKTDIIIQSKDIKDFCKKNKNKIKSREFSFLKLIADEMPMPFSKANKCIKSFFDEIQYIDVMSKAKFFKVNRY